MTDRNQLTITLSDLNVVCENPRRLAQLEKEVVCKQIQEWHDEGIIQPSQSEYASPIVVVLKKDGSYRVCVDYCELNKKIVRDKFPMPNVEEQVDQLAEANYHSFELEALAVVESVRKFRCYLLGRTFKIVTDCMAFKDSVKKKKLNARIAKYVLTPQLLQWKLLLLPLR